MAEMGKNLQNLEKNFGSNQTQIKILLCKWALVKNIYFILKNPLFYKNFEIML